MAPPVKVSQSWAGAPAVAWGSRNPEVLDSSTTIARSGSMAPITSAEVCTVNGPDGIAGRAAAATGACAPAAIRSARSVSAAAAPTGPASVYTEQPSGTRSLGLPG